MKKLILSCLAAAFLFTACTKEDDPNKTNSTDQSFVTQVSISNNAEISAGQLAATKSSNAAVRAYGQAMVSEHTTAQNELKDIGNSIGLAVRDSIDPIHQALMVRLNLLTGYSFDTAYVNAQIQAHQAAVNLFQTEVSSGQQLQVRNYATKYLPHIQAHLFAADSLKTYVK
jgi:putative membrane protein